ncbi:MAG: hypothetical protein ABFD54_09080 [Armatimonadota bacterium]|nr:hypothetical protein [bacterium]
MMLIKEIKQMLAVVIMATVVTILLGGAAFCANLTANGDFETWTNGIPDFWRWYAVNGADGAITKTTAAGTYTSGNSGVMLSWNNNKDGDSGLDKWDNRVPVFKSHVYKMLADVKFNSGEPRLRSALQVFDAAGSQVWEPNLQWGSYLTSDFQTIGIEYTPLSGEVAMGVRFDLRAADDAVSSVASSAYIDNVRLEDVTTSGNRMINGDFENSSSQPIAWRFFNVGSTPAVASASISNDAQSGSNAVLFTVDTPPVAGDVGLDIWDDMIGVVGGENLQVTFNAKKISAASGVNLWCSVTELDVNGIPFADHKFPVDPSTTAYSAFTNSIQLRSDAAFVCIGFRIADASGVPQPGSYLIDNVCAGAASNLLANGDFESWSHGSNVAPDYWRWYAVNGADGSITQTTTPGTYTSGNSGALIAWNNNAGDSSLDKWDNKIPVTSQHIYRLLFDAKHNTGESALTSELLACQDGAGKWKIARAWGNLLTSDFQTLGSELLSTPTEDSLCVRFDATNGGSGSSTYIDNAKLEDVTYGNRLYNGDFENSSSQLLQWRFFNVGGNASASISPDAQSGSKAALLSVTSLPAAGDIGLDIWGEQICVLPSEPLQAVFNAKKVSGGSNTGLTCQILEFNSAGTPIREYNRFFIPNATAYSQFAYTVALSPDAAYADIAFRITDSDKNLQTGSFLIDNVSLGASTVAELPVSITDAKTKPNGTVVSMNGAIVSSVLDVNTLYIETDNRTSGIRVQKSSHGVSSDGVRVNVSGFVWTDASGERYIDASSVKPAGIGSVTALGMTNKTLPGGAGLDDTGLLIRTWGKVSDVDPSETPTWFTVDDGSGNIVKCTVSQGITIDPQWNYVAVTGIASRVKNDTVLSPILFVTKQSDITPE